ncbi:lysophospholipid acyltransferase family protein [Parahaliea mediterranea]|uniref:Lysophospholipid acyltransferase family protein n=2 Tax=Parahaliea mediterranea TaxID=651086 RepID=A0A939IK72_9GAMM|nr:lysophospholipid acyltransferase family protein [Parahaliea mediterranea]
MTLYRLISALPFPLLYAAAWLAYLALYYVAGYRKAVVRNNLARAFPEKSAREITVLAKKFYRRFAQVALEIVKARRMSPEDFRRRVVLRNPELLEERSLDHTRSVIVLTIHQGNWEWMLHGATTALGIPIDPVYKPLHDPVADRMIFDIRSQFGSRPLSMAESTRDILRRRKEFRVFVMVADQSPVRRERSYWTTFMNQEAAFYLGAESLAQLTGFPVLFAECHRRRTGYYEIEFHDLAQPPYDKGSHAIVDAYVAAAEAAIRREPESWLWSNRRWKRDRAREETADGEPAEAGRG